MRSNHMKLCEMLWQQMKFLQEKGILRNFWLLLIVTAAWGHRQRVQSVLKNSDQSAANHFVQNILQSVFHYYLKYLYIFLCFLVHFV